MNLISHLDLCNKENGKLWKANLSIAPPPFFLLGGGGVSLLAYFQKGGFCRIFKFLERVARKEGGDLFRGGGGGVGF